MLYLKMYPARDGDAFLIIDYGTYPSAILIDGGYASTFHECIYHDLEQIACLGYSLDLVVATHIDADHISGLLAFFKLNGDSTNPKLINVKEVWHNSLRSLSLTDMIDSDKSHDDEELINEIRFRGYPMPDQAVGESVEISARQGSSLAALLIRGNYRWNNGDGSLSINSSELSIYRFQPNLRISVVGPPIARLGQLQRWWVAELRRMGLTGKIGLNDSFDDAFEFLCAFEDLRAGLEVKPSVLSTSTNKNLDEVYLADDSVTNGSSISLIAAIGSTRILFLGDSWAEDIEAALHAMPNATFPMIFDAIKISHHGSHHNTSPSLLELIDSPVFLISSNGERYDHPDLEVMKAIVDRKSGFQKQLHFNYSTPASQEMHHYTSKSGARFTIHEDSSDWIKIGER